jgi:mannose-6-phosphate isomerase-like protein (cupin superfamily)
MKTTAQTVEQKTVSNVRGGVGEVLQKFYLKKDQTHLPFSAFNLNEMAPGTTIPEHRHETDEELYYIVSGSGIGVLEGKQFPVQPGDSFFCPRGGSHGILNTTHPGQTLVFVSVFFAP